jgi:cell wall-associated NlpC family hydrolase
VRTTRNLLSALAGLVLAAPAGAQGVAAARSPAPAAAKPAARSAAAVARPATNAAAQTVPRMIAARKAPLAALEARGANPAGPFARLSEVQRDSVVEHTRALLGIRYKWAGATPERGVDCSGLVRYVFARLGIDLPHSSAQLARLGEPVARDTADMRPGDLLVFSKPTSKRISHVGIYVGDGMMVHASSTSRQVVETPVVEYRGLTLRSVRRVFAVDSAGRGGGN